MGAAKVKQPEYVRVNDLAARVEAEPPPPDGERCVRVYGGLRCPRRRNGKRGRQGNPKYCDDCRYEVKLEKCRRSHAVLHKDPAWRASEVARNVARQRRWREEGDPRYAAQMERNKAARKEWRARLKMDDPEGYRAYLAKERVRQAEYRARKRKEKDDG